MNQLKLKKKITTEKKAVIKTILDMYPHLRTDKDSILDKIFDKRKKMNLSEDNMVKEIILEKLVHKEKVYYVDVHGIILDKNTNICGIRSKDMTVVLAEDIEELNKINQGELKDFIKQ